MKNILRKVHRTVIWYSLILGPITVFYGYWISKHEEKMLGLLSKLLNNLGFLWVLSLVYIFLALVFYREFRESLLARLAGFKEGDEREELVTAHAARTTFLLMLAVQIVLLVMSLTSFHMVMNPHPDADGHRDLLTIGMKFSSDQLDIYSVPPVPSISGPGSSELKGYLLPPNMSLILLLLILIQIGAFKLISRRRYEGEN